jgi:hypothetical protein
MIKVLTKRFAELADQLMQVESTHQSDNNRYSNREYVDGVQFLNWCVKAESLIAIACGRESTHFTSFIEYKKPTSSRDTNYYILKRIRAVFDAAREDFEGGYLTSVRNLVHAELAESELEQASELLQAGYLSASAVVAGVVLETTLRTLCDRHGIPHGKLDKMNADLVKAGQYNVLRQKQITAFAAVRNSAAHGKTDEFNHADAEAMIKDIGRFLVEVLA